MQARGDARKQETPPGVRRTDDAQVCQLFNVLHRCLGVVRGWVLSNLWPGSQSDVWELLTNLRPSSQPDLWELLSNLWPISQSNLWELLSNL